MKYAGILMFSPAFSSRLIGYKAVRWLLHAGEAFSVAAEAGSGPLPAPRGKSFSSGYLPSLAGRVQLVLVVSNQCRQRLIISANLRRALDMKDLDGVF